jgi:hypothetical protein
MSRRRAHLHVRGLDLVQSSPFIGFFPALFSFRLKRAGK